MKVHFRLPRPLRFLTSGQSHLHAGTSSSTLEDALEVMCAAYPCIRVAFARTEGQSGSA
jgi:hypothetical protein